MTKKLEKLCVTSAIIAGAITLIQSPALAGALSESPSYNWVGMGYAVIHTKDDAISDLKGLALIASFEPVNRLVIQGAIENGSGMLHPSLGEFDVKGSAFVGTVGTYFPFSERVHVTTDIGVDYEELTISGQGQSLSEDAWYGNAVIGVTAKVSQRVELSAQVQRLEALSDNQDGNWVIRANGAFSISPKIDLISSVAYEDGAPAFIIGARARF